MLEVTARPPILGPRDEPLTAVAPLSSRRPSNAAKYPTVEAVSGKAMLPPAPGHSGPIQLGVRDGNRSVILPEAAATIGGKAYAVSIKGVGARPPLYGDSPLEFALRSDYGATAPGPDGLQLAGSRQVTAESWFGESPYGAQGELPSAYSLMVTEMSEGAQINGFWMCPVTEVVELPADLQAEARARYWYRRNAGAFYQEHRLVPSNVRIYHEAEWTLGQSPQAVLTAFGVTTPESADAFIERFIASGVAALTLYVRTMRKTPWGYRGLDYGDVYLDKDAIVAPDGTLHFVDLEGLDWILGGADVPVEQRIREQFNYNFYEVMYALDLLLRERERLASRPLRQDERRQSLAARFEMALSRDRFVRCEASAAGVDVVVRPPFSELEEVAIRVLDLR